MNKKRQQFNHIYYKVIDMKSVCNIDIVKNIFYIYNDNRGKGDINNIDNFLKPHIQNVKGKIDERYIGI